MVPPNFVPAQVMKGAGKTILELLYIVVATRRNYSITLNFLPRSLNVLELIQDPH